MMLWKNYINQPIVFHSILVDVTLEKYVQSLMKPQILDSLANGE